MQRIITIKQYFKIIIEYLAIFFLKPKQKPMDKQLKHHQKYLEGRRGQMAIQLVIEPSKDTAKYYVIIGEEGKKPLELEVGVSWVQ